MNRILILISFLVNIFFANAQPLGINYQGVARDSIGHPIVNQIIVIRLNILDSTNTGQAIYVETHNITTNASGLFNISIGMGNVVSGVFANIPWSAGDKWLKIEMNTSGGNNYQLIGTTQFLSVPYAMFSNSSGTSSSRFKIFESSGVFIIPPGVTSVIVELWGGGGGGGGGCGFSSNTPNVANGGLAGEYKKGVFTISGNVIVSIGNAGSGGNPGGFNSNGGSGTNGGLSSFGNYLIANGGNGGSGGFISGGGGGDVGCTGRNGANAININGLGGSGGVNTSGNNGNGFSSGGGGGSANCISFTGGTGYNGGNGAKGLIIIYW